MVGWNIQLFKFDISSKRRGHIKAQALTDFIIELAPVRHRGNGGREWFFSVDKASNQSGSGARVIFKDLDGVLVEQSFGRTGGVLYGDEKDVDGPIFEYFKRDVVLEKATLTRKLIREAFKYTLVGEHLYRKGFSFPLLKCLDTNEDEYIMREVHEDICKSHIRGGTLVSKVIRIGY
ncbi:hypothetical protein CR513_47073, partial [Mucuna pruriens]